MKEETKEKIINIYLEIREFAIEEAESRPMYFALNITLCFTTIMLGIFTTLLLFYGLAKMSP